MATSQPPRIIKHLVRRDPPAPHLPRKITLEPSRVVTHIRPKHKGAPLIHMYRDGGSKPSIRWQVQNPKPVGWLAKRSWEPWKQENKMKEERGVRIILEWKGNETDGARVLIRKYKAMDRELVRRVEFDDGVSIPITEHAPLPVEPSPEAPDLHIQKSFAPLVRRKYFEAEKKVKISWYVGNSPTGPEPEEPGPQIHKLRTEPKEPAPSPQPAPKANLHTILAGLPEDLSWDTVLALVLPEEHILWSRIGMLRRAYDRHYYQGTIPHIKLIYPFLNHPFDTTPALSIRLHTALSQHTPFPIYLTTLQRLSRPPCPTTSATGKTLPFLSLHPSPTSLPNLRSLQSSLRTAFLPEINKVIATGGDMSTGVLNLTPPPSLDPGEWTGYVGLGTIRTRRKGLEEVKERFRRGLWGVEGVRAESIREAEMFGVKWDGVKRGVEVKKMEGWENEEEDYGEGKEEMEGWESEEGDEGKGKGEMEGRENEEGDEGEGKREEFKWVVDRVSVLRRERDSDGEEGKLKVVGEIMLGGRVGGEQVGSRWLW